MDNNLSPSTIHNYTAMLADQATISIAQSAVKKTKTRYASNNSMCGLIATLSTIATNHYIPIEKVDSDIESELKLMPKTTKNLTEMVAVAWDTPVYPVSPAYV